jgi:hypothetical protein
MIKTSSGNNSAILILYESVLSNKKALVYQEHKGFTFL